ncbi:MAG: hypothetical protein WBV37_17220 [Nocardioidaceae bacterium]
MQRSRLVAVAVVTAAAMLGLGAGVTTALVRASVSPSSTAAPPPTSPKTSATAPSTTPAAGEDDLYYVDGTIHDGSIDVAYQPRFQTNVASLARTTSGWVLDERFGQDGSRLVLLGADGSRTAIRVTGAHWYDVSPDGAAIAVPDRRDPGVVDFVDVADGKVLSKLTSGYTRVVNAVFTGGDDQLVLLVADAQNHETLLRSDTRLDRLEPLHRVPGQGATLVGVDEAGRHLLMEYLAGSRQCVAVLDLERNAAPLWRSCDYRPLGHAGMSPDGGSVAVAASSDAIGTVTALSVLDAATGDKTSSVRIDSGFRLLDATWTDAEHLVVQGTDDNFATATLYLCTLGVGCDSVPGAGPDDPAKDVAPGSTY